MTKSSFAKLFATRMKSPPLSMQPVSAATTQSDETDTVASDTPVFCSLNL